MSKLSRKDNNENIDYLIQCNFHKFTFNRGDLGYAFAIILCLSLLFIGANISKDLYYWFFLFLFIFAPIAFNIIYDNIRKDKRVNTIIKLIEKKHIEIIQQDGYGSYYYFYTDTNIEYSVCERLYNFLQGNETIQVIIEGNSVYGLVKIIEM